MQRKLFMYTFFVFCSVFVFFLQNSAAQNSKQYEQITAKEAFELLKNDQAILIDLRTKEE